MVKEPPQRLSRIPFSSQMYVDFVEWFWMRLPRNSFLGYVCYIYLFTSHLFSPLFHSIAPLSCQQVLINCLRLKADIPLAQVCVLQSVKCECGSLCVSWINPKECCDRSITGRKEIVNRHSFGKGNFRSQIVFRNKSPPKLYAKLLEKIKLNAKRIYSESRLIFTYSGQKLFFFPSHFTFHSRNQK